MENTGIISTMLDGIATSLNLSIAEAAPLAAGIMATIAGIFLAVKLFKNMTGART